MSGVMTRCPAASDLCRLKRRSSCRSILRSRAMGCDTSAPAQKNHRAYLLFFPSLPLSVARGYQTGSPRAALLRRLHEVRERFLFEFRNNPEEIPASLPGGEHRVASSKWSSVALPSPVSGDSLSPGRKMSAQYSLHGSSKKRCTGTWAARALNSVTW